MDFIYLSSIVMYLVAFTAVFMAVIAVIFLSSQKKAVGVFSTPAMTTVMTYVLSPDTFGKRGLRGSRKPYYMNPQLSSNQNGHLHRGFKRS
ncbi:MAG: hypothetical protein ACKOKF_11720 [Bacteroidota bacterium]